MSERIKSKAGTERAISVSGQNMNAPHSGFLRNGYAGDVSVWRVVR